VTPVLAVALFVVPLLLAGGCAAVASPGRRAGLVTAGGVVHLALTVTALVVGDVHAGAWLALDPLARLALLVVSGLFCACSLYVPVYVALRPDRPTRMFCAALLVFLAMMTLALEAQHVGLMWIALEANTLASAPLIYFDRNSRSLEATWKYILIGAVGIAIALLGSFFLAYSAVHAHLDTSLLFDDLVAKAPRLSAPWLHAGFVLLFVGYGTKLGLAPMHAWKPDAYGEAPGLVGALLAGGLTSCAFVALMRFYHVVDAAGGGQSARELMIVVGLLSMAVGAVFMVRQHDIKRMLAYSSVEHMGILVVGVGIGGPATYGALLHLVNNALTKGVLFLSAANLHRAYGSKSADLISGALRRVPASAILFVAGLFAITATPPFAPFLSELTILRGAFATGHHGTAVVFLIAVLVVFAGMSATVLGVVQGPPPAQLPATGFRDRAATVVPALLLLVAIVVLGLWVPEPLDRLVGDAARLLDPP